MFALLLHFCGGLKRNMAKQAGSRGLGSSSTQTLRNKKIQNMGSRGRMGEWVQFCHCWIQGMRNIHAAHTGNGCPQNIHRPLCLKWSIVKEWGSNSVLLMESRVSHCIEEQPSSLPGMKATGHPYIHLYLSRSSVLKSGWYRPFSHFRKSFKASAKPWTFLVTTV